MNSPAVEFAKSQILAGIRLLKIRRHPTRIPFISIIIRKASIAKKAANCGSRFAPPHYTEEMVKLAEAYECSTAAVQRDLKKEGLLIPLPVIPGCNGDWHIWINGEDDPHDIKRIRNTTKPGFPSGSSEFVKRLEVILRVNLRQRNPRNMNVREGVGSDLSVRRSKPPQSKNSQN